MRKLMSCLIAHQVLAGLVSSPWWVPDLTLAGLILTVARQPARWVLGASLAGVFISAWAIRFSGPIFLSYVFLGWGVQMLAKHWDVTDRRVQNLVGALASLLMTVGLVWLDGVWSLPIVGLAIVQVAMTTLSLVILRRFWVMG